MDIHFDKPNLDKFKKDPPPAPDVIQNIIDDIMSEYNRDTKEAVSTLDINNLLKLD